MLPCGLLKLTTTWVEAVAAAVRRLLESTVWPCGFVEDMTIGMIAAVAVETVVMPWPFVAVILVGMNAIGDTAGLRATAEDLVVVAVIALPWGFVEVMTIRTGTALLVARMTLSCAFVEVTACGISVTGALRVNGEKFVKTDVCP